MLDITQNALVNESVRKSEGELKKYEFTASELEMLFSGFYVAVRQLPENIGPKIYEAIRCKSEDVLLKCLEESIRGSEEKKKKKRILTLKFIVQRIDT